MRTPTASIPALLALLVILATGCSSGKELRGRVIASEYPSADFINVSGGDPMMVEGSAVPGARIEIIRDPRRLSRETVATGVSGADGVFRIPVDAFGAGWMDESWLFRCTHPRYPMVELFAEMPSLDSDRVLRINIGAPGGGGRPPIDEAERIRRELERYGG